MAIRAITIEQREAEAFDEEAAAQHMADTKAEKCKRLSSA